MNLLRSLSALATAESVTEGHPDKLCDQIADAVLDAHLAQDPYARVGCEVCVTGDHVIVMGEITSRATVDVEAVVRRTLRRVGYVHRDLGIGCDDCEVRALLRQQSPEISRAVAAGAPLDSDLTGAGDQGIMIGFACREAAQSLGLGPVYMPLPIVLAHRICRRMAEARKTGLLPYLRPDGKCQVTLEYANGAPTRLHTAVISAQHDPGVDQSRLRRDLIEHVLRAAVPLQLLDARTVVHTNPAGSWSLGGPAADTGLTGRKQQVDTYGPAVRHGGGSFSGKDPTKVDRSGAYAARHATKNIVAAGLAERAEVEVSYAIGRPEPVALTVNTFGTARAPEAAIRDVLKWFDFRPGAIIRRLDLRKPMYEPLAAYGHMGRADGDYPWERVDVVSVLRRDGLIA